MLKCESNQLVGKTFKLYSDERRKNAKDVLDVVGSVELLSGNKEPLNAMKSTFREFGDAIILLAMGEDFDSVLRQTDAARSASKAATVLVRDSCAGAIRSELIEGVLGSIDKGIERIRSLVTCRMVFHSEVVISARRSTFNLERAAGHLKNVFGNKA